MGVIFERAKPGNDLIKELDSTIRREVTHRLPMPDVATALFLPPPSGAVHGASTGQQGPGWEGHLGPQDVPCCWQLGKEMLTQPALHNHQGEAGG